MYATMPAKWQQHGLKYGGMSISALAMAAAYVAA